MMRWSVFKRSFQNFSTDCIISAKGDQVRIPKISLHEFMWRNLERWPDKTATVCFESQRSYTYHQLYKKSSSITRFLRDGVRLRKQETVGVVLPNIPEYPIVLLGAAQAGLRITTCNPNYTPGILDPAANFIITLQYFRRD
jgi:4-coumarate--CoA ligase